MTQNSYNEVVNITYNIEQAEAAIDKLLRKIQDFDTHMAPLGLSAGRNFSRGFNQGMEGAFGTVDRLEARLRDIIRMQGQVSNTPTPPSVFGDYGIQSSTYHSQPASTYSNAQARNNDRYDEYGQFNHAYAPPRKPFDIYSSDAYRGQAFDQYGQPRQFPPIGGGSGQLYGPPQFNKSSDVFGLGNSSGVTKAIEQLQSASRALMVVAQSDLFPNTNSSGFGRMEQPDMSGLDDFLRLIDQYKGILGTSVAAGPTLPPVIYLPASTQVDIYRGLMSQGAGNASLSRLGSVDSGNIAGAIGGPSRGLDRPYGWGQGLYNWGMGQGGGGQWNVMGQPSLAAPGYSGAYNYSGMAQSGLRPTPWYTPPGPTIYHSGPTVPVLPPSPPPVPPVPPVPPPVPPIPPPVPPVPPVPPPVLPPVPPPVPPVPWGPYTERQLGQTAADAARTVAMGQFGLGNLSGFESIMQNWYNPARIMRNIGASRVAEFETQADLNRMGAAPGAGSQRFSQRAFLGAQINQMQAQFNTASLRGSWQDVDKLGSSLDVARKRYAELGGEINDKFGSSFMRHLGWVARGIAIWTTLNTAMQVAGKTISETLRLESTQARLGFITGQDEFGTTEQYTMAARYGVSPGAATAGLIAGSQFGATGEQQQQARQLALIFGADQYANALNELAQTQRRADAAGAAHINVMDYIATAYKNVPGSLESYFDALQQAITLQNQFGLSSEQTAMIINKVAYAAEQTPEAIGTLYQSVLSRLENEQVQKDLLRFGVQTDTPGAMLRDIAGTTSAYIANGRQDDADALMQAVQGGLAGPQRIKQMVIAMQEFSAAVNGVQAPLENAGLLIGALSDTGQAKINRLTASWDLFLASLAQTEQFDWILNFTDQLAAGMQATAIAGPGGRSFEDMSSAEQRAALGQFVKETGGGSLRGLYEDTKDIEGYKFPEMDLGFKGDVTRMIGGGPRRSDVASFLEWLGQEQPGAETAAGPRTGAYDYMIPRVRGGVANPPPVLPEVESVSNFGELPQGFSFTAFMAAAVAASAKLAKEVPGYIQTPVETAILDRGRLKDASDDVYRMTNLDPKVISDALNSFTEAVSNFGGFDTFPKGIDWNQFVTGVRENEAMLTEQVPGYEQDPKQIAFWDETTNSYRLLVADSEAIRRELSEQTKLMNQQITGVFNVPSGGEAQVAFFALQQGLRQAGLGDGTSGGAAGPGNVPADVRENEFSPVGRSRRRSSFSKRDERFWYHNRDDIDEVEEVQEQMRRKIPRKVRDERFQYHNRDDVASSPVGVGRPSGGQPKAVGQQGVVVNNVINLRNQVILNGRIISDQILREFQRQLRGNARASGTGGRTNLGV